MAATSKFYELIKGATLEKDVEHVYTTGINLYFPNVVVEHPFACDGLIDTKTDNGKLLKLIIEYKIDEQFNSKVVRAKVITQVLFYIKQFELNGYQLPNICMVGDKNECFVFHSNCILTYLDFDGIDWKIAPSKAHMVYPQLVQAIAEDENVNPFVFDITDKFSFQVVVDKIKDLANAVQRYVHITEHNIAGIYEMFLNRVIKNEKKIKSHDLVGIFMGIITNPDEYYKHPTKKNTLVTPNGNVDIDGRNFDSFFSFFQRTYTPQEKNNLTAISDRLIEDTDRRNSGDFWTPTAFVDYAHDMISKELGENWRDEYVVWDNCCGGKNLTRDYNFKELYCSTLFDSELKIGERYNINSTSFQFDFLNDYFPMNGDSMASIEYHDCKVPNGLIKALKENRKIVFLLNPPYATATNRNETSKKDVAKTKINETMLKDGIGACSQNLYAQFLYRILMIKRNYNLTNLYIGLFSPSAFLGGGSYKKFREQFLSDFGYMGGFLFCASEFADCASNWGINFTMWKCEETADKENFEMDIIERGNEGELEIKGKTVVYNVDNSKTASDWAKEEIKKLKTFDYPNVTSAIGVKNDDKTRGRIFENALGYFYSAGNNIEQSAMGVSLFSSAFGNGHGHGISKDNFTKCTSLFSARKLIQGNWINSKDEYLAPNETHPKYREFELDSVIYSLFNTSSNQSSLRNIEYKGKKWDIKNEFFWMSKEEMLKLANDNNNDETYNDCRVAEDRFVYKFIQEHYNEFSEDAIAVLNKAKELVVKSFPYRTMFDEEHKNYQINNWDCGYYQIKGLCKEFLAQDLKEFQELYKKLGDKMRPMVYELGFLK